MSVVVDAGLTPAQRRLVDENLGLVHNGVRLCLRFLSTSYSREDAFQEGFFGLCRAAQLFDPSRGAFSTIATAHIIQQIRYGRCRLDGANFRRVIDGKEPAFRDPVSLDVAPFDGGDTWADRLSDDPIERATYPEVTALLATLSDRERIMLTLPQSEAARALGMKATSVNRQRTRIYHRLRRELAASPTP